VKPPVLAPRDEKKNSLEFLDWIMIWTFYSERRGKKKETRATPPRTFGSYQRGGRLSAARALSMSRRRKGRKSTLPHRRLIRRKIESQVRSAVFNISTGPRTGKERGKLERAVFLSSAL